MFFSAQVADLPPVGRIGIPAYRQAGAQDLKSCGRISYNTYNYSAQVAELVYAQDLKSCGRNTLPVRSRSWANNQTHYYLISNNEPTQLLSKQLCDGLSRKAWLYCSYETSFRRRNECFVRRENVKKVLHFDGIMIYSHG